MSEAEHICFVADQSAPKMLSLPERILQRPDLALVGTGSLSCIRALYLEAARLGKTHQFFPCLQTAESYATGENGAQLGTFLNEVLKTPGLGGILVYASCADILSQTDFESIFQGLDNPRKIPVRALLRGPMVKRWQMPGPVLAKILAEIPETGTKIPEKIRFFPPPAPDFHFVSSALQSMDALPFLLTAGGCGGALEAAGTPKDCYRLSHTRFNDLQLTMGAEPLAAQALTADFASQSAGEKRSAAALLGSAVPAFMGMDREQVLRESGVPGFDLGCDGFTPGAPGLSRALVGLTHQVLSPTAAVEPGLIEVLGYCGAILGKAEKLTHGFEHLQRRGFTARFWGWDGFRRNTVAQLNWVVSSAGLAQAEWIKKNYGVPYIAGIPFGPKQMLRWRAQVNAAMGRTDEVLPAKAAPEERLLAGKRVLLIGEPLLTRGMGEYLEDSLGCREAVLGVYAPTPAQKRFFGGLGLPLRCFDSVAALGELAENADLIIGDPAFDLGNRPFLPLPDPTVSGDRHLEEPYSIFGRKGSAWLVKNIKNQYKGEIT